MTSKLSELGSDDDKARALIMDSLAVCAHNHVLSRKLLARYKTATGPMLAIIGDWFDLSQMTAYGYTIPAPRGLPEYLSGERPRERLVAFVAHYLARIPDAVVMCENWAAERADLAEWIWPPPRVACFGNDEVYHIATPEIADPELIDATVAARHHWQTGVCSTSGSIPVGDIPDESFLDEIVRNVRHIFIPAFDGSGYLIWSPAEPAS